MVLRSLEKFFSPPLGTEKYLSPVLIPSTDKHKLTRRIPIRTVSTVREKPPRIGKGDRVTGLAIINDIPTIYPIFRIYSGGAHCGLGP